MVEEVVAGGYSELMEQHQLMAGDPPGGQLETGGRGLVPTAPAHKGRGFEATNEISPPPYEKTAPLDSPPPYPAHNTDSPPVVPQLRSSSTGTATPSRPPALNTPPTRSAPT
uniref:Pollen-specific leucine-rich repeat extensin-like protein 4 n=1 Tax=Petromyzon marinus TaxID=7757 RepID=A0AAJ7UFY7_PETMA|nr:pollen-specific leucine-rich repeat extensin-like protein 4 [Petromyzon marinus]XP_032835739.1 pollen-specific leucine-rich repeat extensin-like protein 4 [Petromyzon marinus]